jgi:hypothetical protein
MAGIAAVATVLNEADIVGYTIENLLAYRVDRIYIAHGPSTDGTLKILESFPEVVVVPDESSFHLQPEWTWQLAQQAGRDGAEWIIPFDADEFVYATPDIRTALAALPVGVNKIIIQRWLHLDTNRRYVETERLPKVAWRAGHDVMLEPGNHDVHIDGGAAAGVLWMRELQFRSFAHMARKCVERVERIDPTFARTTGLHQRILAELDPDELAAAWAVREQTPTVQDPIPYRSRTDASLPIVWE